MDNKETMVIKKNRLPVWLKAVLIKAWFAGAVYFFVGLGLFLNTIDQLDITIAVGLILGLATEIVVNRLFRGMGKGKAEYLPYMMFPQKTVLNFFLNAIYGVILAFMAAYTYNLINILIIRIKNLPETAVVLGAEPVLFGIMCMAYDMALLQVKKAVVKGKNKRDCKKQKS